MDPMETRINGPNVYHIAVRTAALSFLPQPSLRSAGNHNPIHNWLSV